MNNDLDRTLNKPESMSWRLIVNRGANFLSVGFFFLRWNYFIAQLPFGLLLHALLYEEYTLLCYMAILWLALTRLAWQLLGGCSPGPCTFLAGLSSGGALLQHVTAVLLDCAL